MIDLYWTVLYIRNVRTVHTRHVASFLRSSKVIKIALSMIPDRQVPMIMTSPILRVLMVPGPLSWKMI